MGEYADMIIDGFVDSETMELIDGDAPGYPRTMYGRKSRQKASSQKKRERIEKAEKHFPEARNIAAKAGLELLRHDEHHYSLRHPDGRILNIYPGVQILKADEKRGPAPFLCVRRNRWNLIHVVNRAIEKINS